MKRNVSITVNSREAQYTVRGVAEDGPEGTVLRYEEPQPLGLGGVTTELTVSPQRAALRRCGAVRSELRFEVGRPFETAYETEHGSIPLRVETRALDAALDANGGGTAELRYTLTLGGAPDERRLRIRVLPEEAGA